MLPNIFVLYTQLRYHWSLSFLGITFFITGALGIAVQSFVVGPVVSRIGERGAVIAGAAAGMTGFVIYALAPTGPTYFIGMPIFALMGLMQPGLQGLMTQHVTASEQGRLQGANQSTGGIAAILGPIIFPLSLRLGAAAPAGRAGAPMFIAAALLALAFVHGAAVRPARGVRRRRRHRRPKKAPAPVTERARAVL